MKYKLHLSVINILVVYFSFAQFNGEIGTLSVTSNWQTVLLSNTYNDPVVFAFLATENEADPAVVSLRNINPALGIFETKISEATNSSSPVHIAETLNYLVLEKGTWNVNGIFVQVGTYASNIGSQMQGFPVPFNLAPIVLTQPQSDNNFTGFIKTRIQSVTQFNTTVLLERDELNQNVSFPNAERIGWMAIEPQSGIWGGVGFEAGLASNYTHIDKDVVFSQTYNDGPIFLGNISVAGGNPASLRGKSNTSTTQNVHVEECLSADVETAHGPENVYYLVFDGATNALGSGTLSNETTPLDNIRVFVENNYLKIMGLENTNFEFKLYNLTGQKVFHKESVTDNETLLTALKKGVYILHLESQANSLIKKIIID